MWRDDESPYNGRHYQLERPIGHPLPLSRPHPPIMIGGGGERKTLRFVARYAQACNLFPGPDLARKLDVLRAHCEAEGRDYDEIEKTCYFLYDVGAKGENAAQIVDQLGGLAELGFGAVLGVTLGVVGFLRAFLLQEHEALRIAGAVSISVLAVVMVGTLVGSLLPLAMSRR